MRPVTVAVCVALAAFAAAAQDPPLARAVDPGLLAPGEEKFLANVRQLTFGGQNAEAYWSSDGKRLIFQSDEGRLPCDQIFTMKADGSERRRVSGGGGKTTCSYLFPGGDRVLYASTVRAGDVCPPRPDRSRGYVWALDDYDIYTARVDGTALRPSLPPRPTTPRRRSRRTAGGWSSPRPGTETSRSTR